MGDLSFPGSARRRRPLSLVRGRRGKRRRKCLRRLRVAGARVRREHLAGSIPAVSTSTVRRFSLQTGGWSVFRVEGTRLSAFEALVGAAPDRDAAAPTATSARADCLSAVNMARRALLLTAAALVVLAFPGGAAAFDAHDSVRQVYVTGVA